jgi:hypothetical protein
MTENACRMCGRLLDQPSDRLSSDCGGDCWGCIGEIEAVCGCTPSLRAVRAEIAAGIRKPIADLPEDDGLDDDDWDDGS